MIVASRALQSESEESGSEGVEPVDNILDSELLGDTPSLDLLWVEPIECRSLDLFLGGVGEQVAGYLLRDELIVGHVFPEGIDYPVSPRPDEAISINLVSIRVRVAGNIQPFTRHALSVGSGTKKPADNFLIRCWGLIREEGIELGQSRRESCDVECYPAQPASPGGFWIGLETRPLKFICDKSVDLGAPPFQRLWVWGLKFGRNALEGPMSVIGRSFLDPAIKKGLLLFVETELGFRRGHDVLAICAPDPVVHLALLEVPCLDANVASEVFQCVVARIEPEVRLLVARIRAMTLEAAI